MSTSISSSIDFSLNAVQGDSIITLTWSNLTNFTGTSTNIPDKFVVIINDIGHPLTSSNYIQSFTYSNDPSRNSIVLGTDKLTLGETYHILLEAIKGNQTKLSETKIVKFVKAPLAPTFTLQASDNSFYITPLNYSHIQTSSNFGNDGYSRITSYDIFISLIGSGSTGMKKISINQNNDTSGNALYDTQYLIEASGNSLSGFLTNGNTYEIGIRAVNAVGQSNISSTQTVTPNDTPNVIPAIYALSKLPYQTIKGVTQTATGEVMVLVRPPEDFNTLRANPLNRITTIVVGEQQYDLSNNKVGLVRDISFNVLYDVSGNCTNFTNERLVNGGTNVLASAGFTVDASSGFANNIFTIEIPASESRLGNRYKYFAYAVNRFGTGPKSLETTVNTVPNALPSTQSFTLTNVSTLNVAGFKSFDGTMNINISALSSLRGCSVDSSGSLFLTIDSSGSITSNAISVDASGNYIISGLTKLGTKHIFTVERLAVDPQISTIRYKSAQNVVSRTPFRNPSATPNVETYSVDTSVNFIVPTRLAGQPAVRVICSQILDASFNGSLIPDASGNVSAYYRLFRNSSLVSDVEAIPHNFQTPNASVNFVVAATLGNDNSYYVRSFSVNGELGEVISSVDSSPNRNGAAVSHLSAVTSLTTVPIDASSALISWVPQSTASFTNTTDWTLRNRITVRDASSNVLIDSSNIPVSSASSYTVRNLTPGQAYIAIITAEALYTKRRWDSVGNNTLLYNNAIMRQNLASSVWVSYSSPSSPTNIEAYPTQNKVDLYWDPPTNSNGTNMSNIAYKIYLGSGISDVLAIADLSANITNDNYTRYLVDASATSTYDTIQSLNSSLIYYYSIRSIASAGGMNILSNYTVTDASAMTLNATASSPVPSVSVNGTTSAIHVDRSFIPASTLNTPQLTTSNAASTITANVVKDGIAQELVLILANNDAVLDNVSALVDPCNNLQGFTMFDTFRYASGGVPGLTNLIQNNVTHPKFSYSAAGSGTIIYRFDNVPNGIPQKITAYWSSTQGSRRIFSPAAIATDTAIDAPSQVQTTSFTVSSQTIDLAWSIPANNGGAGTPGYGPLLYKIDVYDPSNNTSVPTETKTDISGNSFRLSNLLNGQNYKALVYPFFKNLASGSETVRNTKTAFNPDVSGNPLPMRPNAAPIGPTVVLNPVISSRPGDQRFLLSVTTPGNPEAQNYPLTRYEVYITSAGVERKILDLSANINNSSPLTYTNIVSTDGSLNLVNGTSYSVRVKTIPAYTYAQTATDKSNSVTPFGELKFNTISKNAVNARSYDIVFNANGGALPNSLVGVFNDASGTKLVQTLVVSQGQANFPTFSQINSSTNYSFTTNPITNLSSDALFILSATTNSVISTALGYEPNSTQAFKPV
jgi:hypothetical protein